MSRFALHVLALVAIVTFVAGCNETPVSLPLRSLERSGDVSFACVDGDGQGYDINSCPDFDSQENPRHLLALVTQTLRGEVAVVDLSAGRVVDLDKSTPGYSFIPVGGNPIDIVTTPGGIASFVGVGEVGKEGIFAIPSSCTAPPQRDLTSWSACRLPTAPGEMAIVIDPPAGDPPLDRASCDAPRTPEAGEPGTALAATRTECPADLALENAPPGRRKLVVTLPEMGMFAIIDAQAILDREPGTYQPCPVERWIELDPSAPTTAITQKVPADLQAPGCVPTEINYGPKPAQVSFPGGIEVADDRLFISDRSAPVIHVRDMRDPCQPFAEPPLLPLSYESQNRVVTTSQVAVSPPTSKGERFAYAIDDWDGSVMIFDVTQGHSDRTPIVRPGSPRLPFEAPDRIKYAPPAVDVVFALRDAPIADPSSGVATVGTLCDPDPKLNEIDPNLPAIKYRPSTDFSKGAGPRNLRGVFGLVMLKDGQVAVVDVEDFDAKCRRPVQSNATGTEDFRGCVNDPDEPVEYLLSEELGGKRTVSGELSCRIFEQHRSRSGHFLINAPEFGVNAPALRSFPTLRAAEGGSLAIGQTEEGRKNPKLLAVDFPNPKDPANGSLAAEVYVGTTLYQNASASNATPVNALNLDPAEADRLSLALSFNEPRAYGGDEDLLLEYEGTFVAERPAGFPELTPGGQIDVLRDSDASFCNRGVQDEDLTRQVGIDMGVAPADLDAFAVRHADYVQVTQKLPDEDSTYWDSVTCGDSSGKAAFFACKETFGTEEALGSRRDFTVVEAYQNRLVIEPRGAGSDEERAQVIERLDCCFKHGAALNYRVRAGHEWVLTGSSSGFQHNVIAEADPSLRCVRDCNPRRANLRSRVFEVSARDCVIPNDDTETDCAIGPARPEDVACVLDNTGPLAPGQPGDECIFQSLTHRFAIYRGNAKEGSQRDSAFLWSVTGGWAPLTANLASQSRAVSPQSMVFVPQIGQLAITDGAAEGLVLVSLDAVAVSRLFF